MLSRNLTELEKRKRQINTLKIFNDNVTEIKEGKEYQVKFTAANNDLSLFVLLSDSFPNEKPVFLISPVVAHSWVNSDGEITSAPGLLNFTVYSDLGRIVQAVISEFGRNPPPLLNDQLRGVNITTSPNIPIRDTNNMGRLSPNSQYTNVSHFSSPTHSNFHHSPFPELLKLSIEQLQYLNDNTDRQEQFIDELPQMKDMNSKIDALILQVEEIADENIAKEELITELKSDIEERVDRVTKLAFENERLNMNYQTICEKFSPRNIKEQLRLAAEKANNEGDEIAESFLRGEMEVDKFISLYLPARTLGQARKTKEEKLTQQLQSLEKAGF